VCTDGKGKYMGSSGYRLVPGNTCDKSKGKDLEQKVERDCRMAKPPEGKVVHQTVSEKLLGVRVAMSDEVC
jgi:hypothetical protein